MRDGDFSESASSQDLWAPAVLQVEPLPTHCTTPKRRPRGDADTPDLLPLSKHRCRQLDNDGMPSVKVFLDNASPPMVSTTAGESDDDKPLPALIRTLMKAASEDSDDDKPFTAQKAGAVERWSQGQVRPGEATLRPVTSSEGDESTVNSMSAAASTDGATLVELRDWIDHILSDDDAANYAAGAADYGSSVPGAIADDTTVQTTAASGLTSQLKECDSSSDFVLQLDSGESVLLHCYSEEGMICLRKVCSTDCHHWASDQQVSEAVTFWEELCSLAHHFYN